jgi:hypothetical protein
VELTREKVAELLAAADLGRAYESEVDPRLYYEQSLEPAFLIARKMRMDSEARAARRFVIPVTGARTQDSDFFGSNPRLAWITATSSSRR